MLYGEIGFGKIHFWDVYVNNSFESRLLGTKFAILMC